MSADEYGIEKTDPGDILRKVLCNLTSAIKHLDKSSSANLKLKAVLRGACNEDGSMLFI